MSRKREILLCIPGIGARIAPPLITDMPELGALDRKAMRETGKPPKVAIIAMGRRIALLANALLREDKLFGDSERIKPAEPAKEG